MKPIEDPRLTEADIVSRRKECRKCGYFAISTKTCDYNLLTGKSREAKPSECDLWQGNGEKVLKNYRHTCKSCGRAFVDHAARTKLCPACKGKAATDGENVKG